MAEPVSGKALAQRFNRYVEYRKTVEKTGKSFTEKMAGLNHKETAEEASKPSTHHLMGGSRHQPPQLAKAKTISDVQAQRLAKYAPLIQESAAKHNVPVELICGVILQESGGNAKARSPVGAQGLMQLMPKTAARFGVRDAFNPAQNIDGGTKYLRFLLDRFHGDIRLALAGYNAGEGAVEKHGNKVPPYRETQNYIPNVLGYTQSMIDILVAQNEPAAALPPTARRA